MTCHDAFDEIGDRMDLAKEEQDWLTLYELVEEQKAMARICRQQEEGS